MRRLTASEWEELLREYAAGPVPQKEFAARHGVTLSAFQWHLYKRGKSTPTPKAVAQQPPRFLPVHVVSRQPSKSADNAVELALRSGVTVRISVGTDTRYVAELCAAVG